MADAVVLIGPTGSGKTPLGQFLERRGVAGRRCHHFDFGHELRVLAASGAASGAFTLSDVEFVRRVLEEGRLLEDRDFHIAERLLRSFLRARGVSGGDMVVMNGLPRHTGQARALEAAIEVRWLVILSCDAETALRRVALNSGGDRSGRQDDSAEAVQRKLALFAERTAPLIEHYRAAGAQVMQYNVTCESRPEDVLAVLEEALRC